MTKEIGLVVFVAEKSTMIMGDILAPRKVVLMSLIQSVPHKKNVWDGKDLEGEPEELEEEVLEPFVRISEGIIQHFCHQHHHLRFDEDTSRDYDDNKLCQACRIPIYIGNLYYCMETCANQSRKIHHPIHPHLLTLVGGYDGVMDYLADQCSACHWKCRSGFFYECGKEECDFKLHVHESHRHPLFLTTKPGEHRIRSVCQDPRNSSTNETFNCIDCEFSLCFSCATLPQKVRYRHDKHMFSLSYGNKRSTMTHWCEACERKIKPQKWFYSCDECCCVSLHIKCLIGKDHT